MQRKEEQDSQVESGGESGTGEGVHADTDEGLPEPIRGSECAVRERG